jgi:hypothetical protein
MAASSADKQQVVANLDDVVRARLGLARASLAQSPSALSDLDSLFLEIWDNEQMLFPDAALRIDEALFPDGIPNVDEMPFPELAPSPVDPSSGTTDIVSVAAPVSSTPSRWSDAFVSNSSQRPSDVVADPNQAEPADLLRPYKVAMCLMPFFFTLGITPVSLRERVLAAQRAWKRIPRLRPPDPDR